MQQKKGNQGAVYLQTNGIFREAEIPFELEVLLDPLEKQLDLPTLFVQIGDLLH